MIQIKSVRVCLEFAKSGLAAEGNDLVRMHVLLGGVETLDGLERPGSVLMPFAWLRSHADATVPKCRESLADRQGFVHGVMQRVKEDGTIELVVEAELLVVAHLELQVVQDSRFAVLACVVNHVGTDIDADDFVAPLGEEDAGPAGAAAKVEQPGRRGRQERHHRADLHEVPIASRVGERLIDCMPYTSFADVLQVIDFALLGHFSHPALKGPWPSARRGSAANLL